MNPNGLVRLLSVNVGIPRDMVWKGRSVHTGIWKNPVTGRCRVGRLNLEGDGQGDLAGHGGEHRAVLSVRPRDCAQSRGSNVLRRGISIRFF
jgi:MOSC domain-containing protein YiiM